MSGVHDFISLALKEGYDMDAIVSHMRDSEDPEDQAFAKQWTSTSQQPEYKPGAGVKTITGSIVPALDWINEHPKEAAVVAGTAATGLVGSKIYKNIKEGRLADAKLRLEQEKMALEARNIAAYEKQVEAQARGKSVLDNPQSMKELGSLSPVYQEIEKVNLTDEIAKREAAVSSMRQNPPGQPVSPTPPPVSAASRQPVFPPVIETSPPWYEWNPPVRVEPNAPTNLQTPAGPAQVPGQVQPSTVAPAQNPPSLTEAVETGQDKTTAIQREVAQMVNQEKQAVNEETTKTTRGRPKGAPNLTAQQRSMRDIGEQVAGGRNWLEAQFGKNPNAVLQYLQEFNKGQDYPNYKAAVASIKENLPGPHASDWRKWKKSIEGSAPPPKEGSAPPSKQGGYINTSIFDGQLTPTGQAAAQFGRQVVGDLKMGAAALPFMFATNVRQQDVGYQRELEQQLRQEKDPARAQQLSNELKKLEEGRYLQAMYKRFVEKNTMQGYRPGLTR